MEKSPQKSMEASSGNPLSVLRETVLFSGCSVDDLAVIASLSEMMDMEAGKRLFSEGDPSSRLFIVREGEVAIRRTDDEGRSVEIARFLPGDCFGELDLFTGNHRNADAFVEQDASLLAFPGEEGGLGILAENHPGVNARLLHAFLVQISARIRGVNALVKENSPLVRELRRQVYVDKLTGLYNRTYFEETLAGVLAGGKTVGIWMYKPDHFKQINDTYGHETGDKVLRYIAEGLKSFVTERDMLYRYMGNENALILPNADRNVLRDSAGRTAEFLRGLDFTPLLGGESIELSVSFGLVLAPEHGTDAERLVERAHSLVMEGRNRGGNLILFPEDSEDS